MNDSTWDMNGGEAHGCFQITRCHLMKSCRASSFLVGIFFSFHLSIRLFRGSLWYHTLPQLLVRLEILSALLEEGIVS